MEYLQSLWKYLTLASPYLLLGLFVGGLIHQFLTVEKMKRLLGKSGIGSVFKAAALGVPLPLCSCGVIPAAVSFRKSGASKGATASFLIATPESGIDSIAVTYAMMDPIMTVLRPIAAFLSAFMAGIGQVLFNKEVEGEEIVEEKKSCCSKNKATEQKLTLAKNFQAAMKYGFVNLINDMAFWLAIGITVGALIDWLVPVDMFAGLNSWQGRLLIMGIGIPLYICASASTPIAASLVMKGMSPGSAILFLLLGPATNVSNILVLQKYLGKKGVFINVLSIAVVALGFSYLTDYMYTVFSLPLDFAVAHHQHHGAAWWEIASAFIMGTLIVKGIWQEEIKPRLATKRVEPEKETCH